MIRATEFQPYRNRYYFDAAFQVGWSQVDTNQDATYFGVWANPFMRKIVSFTEGDVTMTTCESEEEFKTEMKRVLEFYQFTTYRNDPLKGEELPHAMIDGMCNEELKAEWIRLGFGDFLH